MKQQPWLVTLAVTGLAVAASLWLWFGPWLWPGIPWLVAAGLPFLVGLTVPRFPLLFGLLPVIIPYVMEGDVQPILLLGGIGAAWIAAGLGIMLRRFAQGGTLQ